MPQDFSSALKQAGLKVTPARLAILRVFSKACQPLSAEEIHRRTSGRRINLVTVYRTLASLEQSGLLRRVDLHTGPVHYELAAHHHHHIVCTGCGEIEGFDFCDIGSLSRKALAHSAKFKLISQHSLELFGLCQSCVKG
jgi:Fe2+ or Zn2+ uptake regulation protein